MRWVRDNASEDVRGNKGMGGKRKAKGSGSFFLFFFKEAGMFVRKDDVERGVQQMPSRSAVTPWKGP